MPSTQRSACGLRTGEVHIGDDSGGARALTGVDWMVLRVETLSQRDDYNSLSDITGPLKKAINALGGDNAAADLLAAQAARAAYTSEDLIDADRGKVADVVRKKYEAAKQAGSGPAFVADAVLISPQDVADVIVP
jgi:hypothetical protein